MQTQNSDENKRASDEAVMSFMAGLCLGAGDRRLADLCLVDLITLITFAPERSEQELS